MYVARVRATDSVLVEQFTSYEYRQTLDYAGYSQEESEVITTEAVLEATESGYILGWWMGLDEEGPLAIQLYAPTGIPKVYSGECVLRPNAPRNHGIGNSAMRILLDMLFHKPDVHKVVGHIAVQNPGSKRMCDNIGFATEGLANEHLPGPEGTYQDAHIMGYLKNQWLTNVASGRVTVPGYRVCESLDFK